VKEFDLDNTINHRLAMISNSLRRLAYKLIAEKGLDITPEQWTILYYLWSKDGLSLSELTQKSNKDFANVSRIIDKLCAGGYVEKRRSENDQRSYHVYLLPRAGSIKLEVVACWEEAVTILTNGVSRGDQQLLLNILLKMEGNLEDFLAE